MSYFLYKRKSNICKNIGYSYEKKPRKGKYQVKISVSQRISIGRLLIIIVYCSIKNHI